MTTATQAFTVIRTRLEANQPSGLGLRWQNEDGEALPDTPAPFAYIEFLTDPAFLASFGGGRSANRYRNRARITAYVFVPRGQGLTVATDYAEQVATVFRSYRDADISCFDASVYPGGNGADIKPPGLDSAVDNYFYAVAEISLFFDQIG